MKNSFKNYKVLGYLVSIFLFIVAFSQIYIKTQTTLIGYDLGALKTEESEQLDKKSILQMELAKLTNKENLIMIYKNNKIKLENTPIVGQTSL